MRGPSPIWYTWGLVKSASFEPRAPNLVALMSLRTKTDFDLLNPIQLR